jgi:ABC-type nitrate/sulfonate/bicarbonate transport system substrate-binding protein
VAEVEKIGRVVVDYGDFDLQPIILAANRPVVEGKREAVVAFLRGWLAGVKVFKEHPDQATEIVLKHFKDQGFSVNAEVIKLMLTKLDVNPEFTPNLRAYLDEESKLLVQQKNIDSAPDWSKLLNADLLHAAAKA